MLFLPPHVSTDHISSLCSLNIKCRAHSQYQNAVQRRATSSEINVSLGGKSRLTGHQQTDNAHREGNNHDYGQLERKMEREAIT